LLQPAGSIILSLQAGVRINPYVRTFEKDRSFTDYTWEGRIDPVPYVNVGFSFNPFANPGKQVLKILYPLNCFSKANGVYDF
jgi:hypothetical protein